MKKFLTIIITFCFIVTAIPVKAFAGGEELPKFELPKLEPLEVPTLSKSYEDMLEELKKQGFGEYKYDPQKPLPLPEVEAPENTGKTAYEKFIEEYGDMWNSPEHQLDKTSIIPDDKFFEDYINAFKDANEKLFNEIREADRKKMNELLSKKLDMSGLWNLEELKKQIQFKDPKSLLADVPKPDGWDDVKARSYNVPDMNSWLNGPKAEGYGEGGSLPFLPFLKYLFDKLNVKKDNGQTPTPPSPQPQKAPSAVPETKSSFAPDVKLSPGTIPFPIPLPVKEPSPKKEQENPAGKPVLKPAPTPSPAPVPTYSQKLRDFGQNVLEFGKKAAPYVAIGALAALALTVAGPVAGLAVAAI